MPQQINPVQKAPITTVNMDYVAKYDSFLCCWIITDKKELFTIGWTIKNTECASFIAPFLWKENQIYQVELKMQEGCSNSKCNWTCNGCTAKTSMVDCTNNFVTILKYI